MGLLRTPRARAHRHASDPIFDATRIMSAVTVANLAPAAGRAAVARRAVSSGSSRSSPKSGTERLRRAVWRLDRAPAATSRRRDGRRAPAIQASDPRESPIGPAASRRRSLDAPAAAPERAFDVRAAFRSTVERLWNARKAVACAALAVVLSLADAGAAVAGRSGRSGGRMGGGSFRSTSSRSMGGSEIPKSPAARNQSRYPGGKPTRATGQRAKYSTGPRFGLGMPSFFFMPSFGYGYGYGAMGAESPVHEAR